MTIRRANVADFLAIPSLDRTSWGKNRNSQFIPDGEHVWRLWVEHALVFCAEEEGQIVGAIVAFPCTDGKFCVHKAFVEEGRRGGGIGGLLFAALLQEIDTLGVDAFLTVDPVKASAVRLYEKWGFSERRFVPGYYRPQEDRYVLTRRPPR